MRVMKMAKTMAFIAGISAICPPLGTLIIAYMSAEQVILDVFDIMDNGLNWANGTSLVFSAVSLGAAAAALAEMTTAFIDEEAGYGGAACVGGCFTAGSGVLS